ASIPYAVIEMNPDPVRSEQTKGEPIYYGDATHAPVLEHVRSGSAKVVLVAINDPTATRGIVENVKKLNPQVHLIVRTRYLQEMQDLYKMGADEVIPEEFETSVEIFARILAKYLIPRDEIEKLVGEIRADGYEMFRHLSETKSALSDLDLAINDVEVTTLRLVHGSPVAGKTLSDIALRKRHGVSVVAIRRNSKLLPNPGAETKLNENDVLFLLGSNDQIAAAVPLFSAAIERKE
ncbi:MAG: TrkA C-terminal domain-containing protein, partial [Desulfobacterales bacterium]